MLRRWESMKQENNSNSTCSRKWKGGAVSSGPSGTEWGKHLENSSIRHRYYPCRRPRLPWRRGHVRHAATPDRGLGGSGAVCGGAGTTLAKILTINPGLFLLDEPTNHLDIQSREILLEALRAFAGTVVIVSHDRHFLRALATRVLEIDHGEMRCYEGDYDYCLHKSGRGAHGG